MLKMSKRKRGTYVLAYWQGEEEYKDAEDYDVTNTNSLPNLQAEWESKAIVQHGNRLTEQKFHFSFGISMKIC